MTFLLVSGVVVVKTILMLTGNLDHCSEVLKDTADFLCTRQTLFVRMDPFIRALCGVVNLLTSLCICQISVVLLLESLSVGMLFDTVISDLTVQLLLPLFKEAPSDLFADKCPLKRFASSLYNESHSDHICDAVYSCLALRSGSKLSVSQYVKLY